MMQLAFIQWRTELEIEGLKKFTHINLQITKQCYP